jgi:hypothetical protein
MRVAYALWCMTGASALMIFALVHWPLTLVLRGVLVEVVWILDSGANET